MCFSQSVRAAFRWGGGGREGAGSLGITACPVRPGFAVGDDDPDDDILKVLFICWKTGPPGGGGAPDCASVVKRPVRRCAIVDISFLVPEHGGSTATERCPAEVL